MNGHSAITFHIVKEKGIMDTDSTAPKSHVDLSVNQSHRIPYRVGINTLHNPCASTETLKKWIFSPLD